MTSKQQLTATTVKIALHCEPGGCDSHVTISAQSRESLPEINISHHFTCTMIIMCDHYVVIMYYSC